MSTWKTREEQKRESNQSMSKLASKQFCWEATGTMPAELQHRGKARQTVFKVSNMQSHWKRARDACSSGPSPWLKEDVWLAELKSMVRRERWRWKTWSDSPIREPRSCYFQLGTVIASSAENTQKHNSFVRWLVCERRISCASQKYIRQSPRLWQQRAERQLNMNNLCHRCLNSPSRRGS